MAQYVCDMETLISKKKMRVMVNNRPVLLAIHNGVPYAVADKCPHQGFSLFTGKYDQGIISCKEHGLQIDITTGLVVNPLKAKALRMDEQDHAIKTYQVLIENDKIMIEG